MRINLSKQNKIIVVILLVLVLGGTGGYLLWRVNQDDTVAPTDSDASGCHNVCDETGQVEDFDTSGECPENLSQYTVSEGVYNCCTFHRVCNATCGDGTCNGSETVTSCPKDCATCGDSICSSTETLASCPGDCSVCGDSKCTGSETSTTCASDCACKAMVWGNKPSGAYKTTDVTTISPITITNPNSTSALSTGVAITLNGTALSQCGSTVGGGCFSVDTNSSNQQIATITLFGGQPSIAESTYVLGVTLPGAIESCAESTTFVVADDEDVVVPDTGIFDGVMGKIYLGTGFVFFGVLTTQIPKLNYMVSALGERNRIVSEEKRRKREEEKRNRFEKRFK